ncbi:MAG: protein-disulfide reductase DsbD [Gammaproteobacteria bacterium]|nr:protein-disulfide reductase DsbD [Gammaproteobacteria bacterium]
MNLFKSILLSALLSLGSTTVFAQQDELLAPEKAFSLQAWVEGDRVIAEYTIADGYYMYREAFKFEAETAGVKFATLVVPDGKIKHDEFFGDVEIYRNRVAITLPLQYETGTKPGLVDIKTAGQGCADIGVCYPPLYQSLAIDLTSRAKVLPTAYQFQQPAEQTTTVAMAEVSELQNLLAQATQNITATQPVKTVQQMIQPASEKITSQSNPLSILQSLGNNLGLMDEDEIPDPDKAFQLHATIDKNNIIQSEIQIYKHTYLYKNKMKLELIDGKGHTLGPISLPKGDEKNDEFFGLMEVYHDYFKLPIALISEAGASNQLTVAYHYQGCVEDKICYPPITKYLNIDLAARSITIIDERPTGLTPAGASTNVSAIASPSTAEQPMATALQSENEQDRFAGIIANESLFIIIGSFFIAGLLLTFTPCVFPMIPILSGIIAGQGDKITTRKAFTLSLVYVLAMAFTYAVAGAIVGRFGAEFNIQVWFQDPVILSIFAAIFVLLSLSMFGFYDLQMPSFVQSRLTEFSNKQKGGDLVGVGIMGLLSALIVGPCITAPLVGALVFISQTQDWQLGGLALFALGLGMGTPLLLIGTTAGKLLPRAGTWMDSVKAVFGVALIAVAIWLLERILPTSITMLLMATLIIVSAIYMGALDSLSEKTSGWRKLWKGIGLVMLMYGIFYLYGVAAGSKDLIQPLKGLTSSMIASGQSATAAHVSFQQIKGEAGLKQALAAAKGSPVMLDFYADWCISCKEMEKYAFTHPDVLAALKGFSTLQTDVTANDKSDQLFMKSLGIYGPPAILFFDKNGNEIKGSRVVGEMSGDQFAAHIIKYAGQL